MTDSELFETGEGVTPEVAHLPFSPLGVAKILELNRLFPNVGEGSLRELMRSFFGDRLSNGDGLSAEIGRVIGNGKPIGSHILDEAERKRPVVRDQLRAIFSRRLEKLSQEGGSCE